MSFLTAIFISASYISVDDGIGNMDNITGLYNGGLGVLQSQVSLVLNLSKFRCFLYI